MFYSYTVTAALVPYLSKGYRRNAVAVKDISEVQYFLDEQLGNSMFKHKASIYFLRNTKTETKNLTIYAIRYDHESIKKKPIRGFIDVERVSFWKYLQIKLQHLWNYWVVDNTKRDVTDMFIK